MGVGQADGGDESRFSIRSLSATYPHGFEIGAHRHAWGQLVYASRGAMRVTAGDDCGNASPTLWFVAPTRAIWLPPDRVHAIAMQSEVALRTLYLAPNQARMLPGEATALEVSALLRELILHILSLGMLDAAVPAHTRLCGVLLDLVAAAPPHDLRLPLPRDPRARQAAMWLQAHPADKRELHALAREVGASLRTLQRLFGDETGLSLEAFRQKARLLHAVSCLSGGENVAQTAVACGYDSTSAFIAAFRRHFGVTPGRHGMREAR